MSLDGQDREHEVATNAELSERLTRVEENVDHVRESVDRIEEQVAANRERVQPWHFIARFGKYGLPTAATILGTLATLGAF